MPSINYSNARQNFKELISKVNEDSVTYTITTKEDKNAVILAEKDYNAILETMYLQSNPANVSPEQIYSRIKPKRYDYS